MEIGSYPVKGNTAQQHSWMQQVSWTPKSREVELDSLRLEEERAQNRTRRETWASSEQRYRRINKMARQKTYEKRRDEWYRNMISREQTIDK